MRTLPPNEREGAAAGVAPSVRLRAFARCALQGCFAVVAGLAIVSADPGLPGRWVYRATIRARGGVFVSFPGAVLQSGFSDCGPAALATLLRALGGTPPPTDSIAAIAGTGARGTSFGGLAAAARQLGVPGELRRLDPAALATLGTPLIAWVDRRHFVTVVPESARAVLVLDPQVGPYRIGLDRLRRYWSGEALVPLPVRTSAGPASTVTTEGETT